MLEGLTPEHELACLLCRPALSDDLGKRAAERIAGGIDWVRFLKLVDRDGILPLVGRHFEAPRLGHAPLEIRSWFRVGAAKHRAVLERLAVELAGILSDLEAAGLTAVPFKGPVLGEQLWGDALRRPCDDLDFLVRPGDLPAVVATLGRRGYALHPDFRNVPAINERTQMAPLVREEGLPAPIHLEVQTSHRCHWLREGLPLEAIWAHLRRHEFRGTAVRVLPDDWNLALLALHAYKHGFQSLRWTAEVQAFGAQTGAWGEALRCAETLGAGGEVRMAQRVCEAVCGEAWVAPAALERSVRRLASCPFGPPLSIARQRWLQLGAMSARGRIAALAAFVLRPNTADDVLTPLPATLRWLHFLIRPVRLTSRLLFSPLLRRIRDRIAAARTAK